MKAYCINLDRRSDRLAYMTQEFARHGIVFVRISAVDGTHPDIAAKAAQIPPTALGARMSNGAYGAFQSHRACWQNLVDSGDAYAMVFEDDLHLADGIGSYLAESWIPADADIVKLETFGTRTHIGKKPDYAAHGRRLVPLRSSHIGAGCYVLSRAIAARLLQETATFNEPIDEVLFNDALAFFDTARIYQMLPAPVVQGKRPGSGASTSSWSATSITERFADGAEAPKASTEPVFARLMRRLGQEMRGSLQGTRYIVVPHG
ncbi:MAG: glycosyltransferase family 25 protein [Microgenomates group bacterium]